MNSAFLGALAEVLLVNIVLSGDNAVVIGLAARSLPPESRRRAILLGGGLAVAMRLALTLPAEFLLQVPLLRACGGLLLAWIAYRLVAGDESETAATEGSGLATAVRMIVLADLTMSLDNILAVAAVADRSDHPVIVLIAGLAMSIPIVLAGGNLVARFMNRLPILIWLGAAILGYTAGELIAEDKLVEPLLDHLAHGELLVAFSTAALVLATAYLMNRSKIESTGEPAM